MNTLATPVKNESPIELVNHFNINNKISHHQPTMIPLLRYNGATGLLVLKGNLDKLNVEDFKLTIPILLSEHFLLHDSLTCYISIASLNSQNIQSLYTLYKNLSHYHQIGMHVNINWFAPANSNGVIETGKDLSELYEIDTNIIPID